MNIKRFIIWLFLSIVIGLTILALQLRHNIQLRTIIEKKLEKEISTFCNCTYKAKLKAVSILQPSVTLEHVTLNTTSQQWSISIKELVISTSWLSLITHRTCNLTVTCSGSSIATETSGSSSALINHFTPLLRSQNTRPSFLTLNTIILTNTHAKLNDTATHVVTEFDSHALCKFKEGSSHCDATILNATVTANATQLLKNIRGALVYTAINFKNPSITFKGVADCAFAPDEIARSQVSAVINTTRSFSLKNNLFNLSCASHDNKILKGTLSCPCYYVQNLFKIPQPLAGDIFVNYEMDFAGNGHASLTFNDVGIKHYSIPQITATLEKNNSLLHGTFQINTHEEAKGSGNYTYDIKTKTWHTSMNNTNRLTLGTKDWVLLKDSSHFSCGSGENGLEGKYILSCKHIPTDSVFDVTGTYAIDNQKELTTQGECNGYQFSGSTATQPFIIPHHFICLTPQKEPIITFDLTDEATKKFRMEVAYELFYNGLEQFFDYSLPGKGDLLLEGTIGHDKIKGAIIMHHGLIRIPDMYNFLSEFTTECLIHFSPFFVQLTNLRAQLHKGHIESSSLLFGYDTHFFMDIPIQLHKCLFNKKHSFFAQTSGFLSLSKKRAEPAMLQGTVIIEKGHMKENPFSLEGQQDVMSPVLPSVIFEDKPLNLNLNLITHDPLIIKTPQLNSQATCDVKVTNTLKDPRLKGALTLEGGTFEFPYKPLTITTARITFAPEQQNAHQLHIVAEGTIKNYSVNITVSGTAADPHIILTSCPSLPEEQIIALLYTGSAHNSLNTIVPTFLMSNIQQRLLGTAQHNETAKHSWIDTLKRIRLLPSFADQSGRGGLRGRIEIDITDRLRAILQRNFSLTEDTRMEVEYDISDDIVIKGTRDERSDLGAEVEMRFKF